MRMLKIVPFLAGIIIGKRNTQNKMLGKLNQLKIIIIHRDLGIQFCPDFSLR
ncbi:MAG TPA: hypothetical protein VIP70_06090 [Nitrososphaeraceae archaeon]